MINLKHILGKRVLTNKKGQVGFVKDVLEEPTKGMITHLVISKKHTGGVKYLLPADQVRLINEDVRLFDDVIDLNECKILVDKPVRYFEGNRVVTEGGDYLGRVSTYFVDPAQMQVAQLVVLKRFFGLFATKKFLIGRSQIRMVTEAKITVADTALKISEEDTSDIQHVKNPALSGTGMHMEEQQ